MVKVGQALLGKTTFPNGTISEKKKPYLVVSVNPDSVGLIVASTVREKEHKVLFPTNSEINNFDPPFDRRSFAQLDSLTYVPISDLSNFRLLRGGACLQQDKLDAILEDVEKILRI